MMVAAVGIPKSAFLLDAHHANANANANVNVNVNAKSSKITTSCCSKNNKEYKIPKLEAFSRSKFERGLKDLPLINKSENQLADYCTLLEGDSSYSCWQAYFELKDLQKEYTKEEVERLIIEAGGVKSLIGCLHGVAAIHKANNKHSSSERDIKSTPHDESNRNHIHIPDGLPKTAQELEEEEKAMMPDSAYTRLLRLRGTHPPWEVAQTYAKEVEKLAFKLMELMALSLEHKHHRFNGFFEDHTTFVRLNYYPPCPSPHLVLGVTRHKDAGGLTILAQDDVGGLQVRRKSDGEWVSVKPDPAAFIVNTGDIIQVWSKDKYESVEHRVMVNSDKGRLSMPFFFNPAHYVMIKPLEELVHDQNPAKYREYNYGTFFSTKRKSNLKKLNVDNLQISDFKICE